MYYVRFYLTSDPFAHHEHVRQRNAEQFAPLRKSLARPPDAAVSSICYLCCHRFHRKQGKPNLSCSCILRSEETSKLKNNNNNSSIEEPITAS